MLPYFFREFTGIFEAGVTCGGAARGGIDGSDGAMLARHL
jgi:hypothetical protein